MNNQTSPRLRLSGITVAAIAVVACAWMAPVRPAASTDALGLSEAARARASAVREEQDGARRLIEFGVARTVFNGLSPDHQLMLQRLAASPPIDGPGFAVCFAPGTSDDVVHAFNLTVAGLEASSPRYQVVGRWTANASNAGPFGQGDPTTLTYSFIPDGTSIPSGVGEPVAPSNLFAFLDGIYGNTATWQALYAQIFARWHTLCGVTYVFQPTDDGATFPSTAGLLGVRGDCRLGGHPIDGNSGILAYNQFPNNGDMVIDTSDNFFADQSSNSIHLRNVLAHEHGHGLGMAHVCPIQTTKLMEPFYTGAFDGPRHDDIRLGQRFYGDPNEPDNTRATAKVVGTLNVGPATVLGTVPAPSVPNGSLLSIDGDGDQDFFRFSITAPRGLTAIVTPLGSSYDSSAQSSSCTGSANCCSGNIINSLTMANLALEVQDANGAIIGTFDVQPAGIAETASKVPLPAAGDYYVRVFETNTPTESQLYTLSLQAGAFPLGITLPNGAPTALTPGIASSFNVQINPGDDSLVANSPTLFYSYENGPFQSIPLIPLGGNLYRAPLPPPACTDTPRFYVSAQGVTTGTVTQPFGAPTAVFTAIVGTLLTPVSLNFQTDGGWTFSNDAALTDGTWERGVPVINANCAARGAPQADFDGSGQCWLTHNSAANSCNSDVDGGSTTLLSAIYDVSTLDEAKVSYARWFANTGGQNPQTQPFIIDVSSDGGSNWTNLETVGPTTASANPEVNGGWFVKTLSIASFVTPTTQFRIRFTAQDPGAGSVVEAGIDAFKLTGRQCTPVTCTPCDVNGDGVSDGLDVSTFTQVLIANSPTQAQVCAGDVHVPKDGVIDSADVADFVNCVLGAP